MLRLNGKLSNLVVFGVVAMNWKSLGRCAGGMILSMLPGLAAGAEALAPAVLPGEGLAQHDFFYAGEQKQQKMFIVKGGKIAWSYVDLESKGEISDAVLMSNGNIVFAHQYGITEIKPDKTVVWQYDAPAGTETHTAQPIGRDRILFIENGSAPFLRVVNVVTGKTELEFSLPVGNPKSVHGQFRHARLTEAGTVLVAHMDMNKVCEYDSTGKEVWSFATESPWSADRLPNGHTLIATNKKKVQEVNSGGKVVWELTAADLSGYAVANFQIATRLPNGNTLVNNWPNTWNAPVDAANPPAQAWEVTPEKKVVWALRSWTGAADLGPATTIQLVRDGSVAEQVHFGSIR